MEPGPELINRVLKSKQIQHVVLCKSMTDLSASETFLEIQTQTAHYQHTHVNTPPQLEAVYTAPLECLQGTQTKHARLKLRAIRHSLDAQW